MQAPAIETVDVLAGMEKRNELRNTAVDGRFAVADAHLHRLDRRMSHLKDELELTIKREVMGLKAQVVRPIEERLAAGA